MSKIKVEDIREELQKDGWKLINVCSYSDPFEKESGTEFTLARFQ